MPGPGDRSVLIGTDLPDLTLPRAQGGLYALRSRVGVGPLALFFFIRSGTST